MRRLCNIISNLSFAFKLLSLTIPLRVNFGHSTQWRNLVLVKVYGVSRDQGDASCSTLSNRVTILKKTILIILKKTILIILEKTILITMENYSNSDTSSESEFESNQSSAAESDCDEDENEPNQSLEPEPSKFYNEYESAL